MLAGISPIVLFLITLFAACLLAACDLLSLTYIMINDRFSDEFNFVLLILLVLVNTGIVYVFYHFILGN